MSRLNYLNQFLPISYAYLQEATVAENKLLLCKLKLDIATTIIHQLELLLNSSTFDSAKTIQDVWPRKEVAFSACISAIDDMHLKME